LLLTAAVGIWTIRLGSFLAMVSCSTRYYDPFFQSLDQRAIKAGGDSRFDKIKQKPGTFAVYWFAQGKTHSFLHPSQLINPREATWIMAVGLPVYLCNAMPAGLHPALGLRDFAALGVYAGSLLFEVISDRQKAAWRRAKDAKEHDEKFITSGLWSISRHPKYVYIPFY
jgi:steroid 5-alpha reductase family enzyme